MADKVYRCPKTGCPGSLQETTLGDAGVKGYRCGRCTTEWVVTTTKKGNISFKAFPVVNQRK